MPAALIKPLRQCIIVFLMLTTGLTYTAEGKTNERDESKDPLIIAITASPATLEPRGEYVIKLNLQLPSGYHAYEDQFKITFLEPSGITAKKITLNPLKTWFDKFSKTDRSGIEGMATMDIVIETPDRFVDDNAKVAFELTYQACSDSFCLFPKSKDISIPTQFGSNLKSGSSAMPNSMSLFSIEGFNYFLGQSTLLALLLAFFAGILTSFTPCIFPMIPITLAILNNHAGERTRLNNFLVSVIYVLGIATTYSLLGLIAAKSGMLFGSALSSSYVLIFICGLFFLMALSMYGVFEFQVPHFITNRFGRGSSKKGFLGAYLSGIFAGIVASPCVGPVLVAILTYVSTQQSGLFGFFLLFTYAMGLGLIFIVLGVSTELLKKVPRSGPWLEATKFILGSMMLVGFFYYFHLLVFARVFEIVLGLTLIVLASMYGAFMKPHQKKSELLQKGFMQAILILGISLLVIGVNNLNLSGSTTGPTQDIKFNRNKQWIGFTEMTLAQAKIDAKPVIVDFFADWCAACWELEEKVFSAPEFIERTKDFALLKMDATKNSPELNELKKKYGIVGLPTILFIDSRGNWVKAKTLTEFEKKDLFLKRIEDLK